MLTNLPEHPIDQTVWKRRHLFEKFSRLDEPFHGVCLRVECTATFDFAKQRGLSVFLCLVHRALAAAHCVENFRTRIVDGNVWQFDDVHAGSAVGRDDETIGFGHYLYRRGVQEFAAEATREIARVKGRDDLETPPWPNVVLFSTLPWFDFTSISHASGFSNRDNSAPKITFGKITEAGGCRTMPVSIHVHHGLADGLHVARFVESFQALLHSPERQV